MLRVAEAVERTDTGRQRDANEDSYFARAPVFAVADGMGGARAGEVASRIAVDAFEPERDSSLQPERYLEQTAHAANLAIFERAKGDETRSGMGTTLTSAVLDGDSLSIGHVGDSRAYLFRDGELTQLTRDHSLVEEWRRQGRLTAEQAEAHPQRSIITRALGPEPEVEVDTFTLTARDGDLFLLCSDGLTTMVPDGDVGNLLGSGGTLDQLSRRLIDAANERGGRDNITVVLFRLASSDREAAPASEDATLVGVAAEREGFSAEAVRAGAREPAGVGVPTTTRRAAAPAASDDDGPGARRWISRTIVGLLIAAALVAAAYFGLRQVYFIGTDEGNRIALFRGLPYDLPLGIDLYSERSSAPIMLDDVPEDRRSVVVDHELRSYDDAVSLIEDLEKTTREAQDAAEAAAQSQSPTAPGSGGPSSAGGSGSGSSGGGEAPAGSDGGGAGG